MTETLRNRDDDDEIEVLDLVHFKLTSIQTAQPKSLWIPFLQLVEDHIYACHELLSFARNHANYQESQQWRDWAYRLDIILPEIGRYDW